eukprot:c18348_g1_i1.p1 GENE.c18348_g1_i1~~c18348_g1_i1.p1  ORF type:complete len:350 (+),score=75.75 c18348_g1_i1:108-1052(+)
MSTNNISLQNLHHLLDAAQRSLISTTHITFSEKEMKLTFFVKGATPVSEEDKATIGYGDDAPSINSISVPVYIPSHLVNLRLSQWHLKPGLGAARFLNRIVSKTVLELCNKAEVALSDNERALLQRDSEEKNLEEHVNPSLNTLTVKKEYVRELKHEATFQPGVNPSVHKHSRALSGLPSAAPMHNTPTHTHGLQIVKALAAQHALLISDKLSPEDQQKGISNLTQNIILMLRLSHDVAPWNQLVLVLARDFSPRRIGEGFLCVPCRFTIQQFKSFLQKHAPQITNSTTTKTTKTTKSTKSTKTAKTTKTQTIK